MNNTVEIARTEVEESQESLALAEVVDLVARDARRAPEAYLAETIVPEGGE
jgi:hypothetical protein